MFHRCIDSCVDLLIDVFMYPFIYTCIDLFINVLIYSLICRFIHWCSYLSIHLFIGLLINSFIDLYIDPFVYFFIYSLIHSLIHVLFIILVGYIKRLPCRGLEIPRLRQQLHWLSLYQNGRHYFHVLVASRIIYNNDNTTGKPMIKEIHLQSIWYLNIPYAHNKPPR